MKWGALPRATEGEGDKTGADRHPTRAGGREGKGGTARQGRDQGERPDLHVPCRGGSLAGQHQEPPHPGAARKGIMTTTTRTTTATTPAAAPAAPTAADLAARNVLATRRQSPTGVNVCRCVVELDDQTGAPAGVTLVGPCGRTTGRDFAPGHDARTKGTLVRAALAGATLALVAADGTTAPVDPTALAVALDWTGIVAAAVDQARRPKAARTATTARPTAPPVIDWAGIAASMAAHQGA